MVIQMKFDVLLKEDKRFPWMSSLHLKFLRHMDERETWREVPAVHRHTVCETVIKLLLIS